MPELPEVETSRRGILPHVVNQRVEEVVVRQHQLRWPIPKQLAQQLTHHTVHAVERRGKYILLRTDNGTLLLHLGMSGRLCILPRTQLAQKHDHVDIHFANQTLLRFTDPRRFGAILWTQDDPLDHTLLKKLGPEPLTKEFNAGYLFQQSRGRRVAVKSFIMNSQVVVGVGNIYASEALFAAGIHPQRHSQRISQARYDQLVKSIKYILKAAIKQGGTTLKDFLSSEGKPGYFQQSLLVYGRAGLPCVHCGSVLLNKQIEQRSSVYCPTCQR